MSVSTLLRFNVRYYRRHSFISLLCLMGIALGVGIVVAVELVNNSALSSFSSSVDFLAGKATHSVISDYGRINEKAFVRIWKDPEVAAASPVIEVMANTKETGDESIRFLGLDPLLDAPFRTLTPGTGDEEEFRAFLAGSPPGVYLSPDVMGRYDLKAGDTLTVLTAGLERPVKILGPLPGSQSGDLGENIAVMDISAAQELFGKYGYLDRIDIIATDDAENFTLNLPTGLRLNDRTDRKKTLESMLYSFQLNLAAMSLLALFVGVFLIYNFSMFSVLSRREDLSLLLTLGSTRRELVLAFMVESAILGAVGSFIGIGFGFFMAWAGIGMVSSTISELYFHVQVEEVRLTRFIVFSGIGVGFTATALGIFLPALEVAGTPPVLGMKRRTIEDRAHAVKSLLLLGGVLCFAASLVAAWASRFSIFWGFTAAFGMTAAFALFTPSLLSVATHYIGVALKRTMGALEAFLAARIIRASLSRTSMAVAALAVALSMTIGVDTMIHSFRESVNAWLDGSLMGDLYISPSTTKWSHPLPPDLLEHVRKDPRVDAVEEYSTYDIRLNGKPVKIRVVDGRVLKDRSNFIFLSGDEQPWERLIAGEVFISESLAFRFELQAGDTVTLQTPEGPRTFSITAVVRDYSSDRGTMHMDRRVYEEVWDDERVQSVALFLKPGESPDAVRNDIAERFPGLGRTVVSNVSMRKNVLEIFDKTFAPTSTLKGVTLLVALLGVATALMAILIERSREMTVLGYLGLTPGQLAAINVYQALIMGTIAFVISVVCGEILSYIIIFAINYRSFGWSIDVYTNVGIFARTFALTIPACLASSLYPTWKLIKAKKAMTVEEE